MLFREIDQETYHRPDVVLIMGFGATHGCWAPQLEELLGSKQAGGPPRARVLLLDNRGVGRSESPLSRKAYTTTIMATDVICILVSFWTSSFVYRALDDANYIARGTSQEQK